MSWYEDTLRTVGNSALSTGRFAIRNLFDVGAKTGDLLGLGKYDGIDDTPTARKILGDSYFEEQKKTGRYKNVPQEMVQGIARSGGMVAQGLMSTADTVFNKNKEIKPIADTPVSRFMYGDDLFDRYSGNIPKQTFGEVGDPLTDIMLGESAKGGMSQKLTSGLMVAGFTGLDFTGLGGPVKNFLLKTTKPKKIAKYLSNPKNVGGKKLSKEFIEKVSPHIAKADNETKIKSILDSYEKSRFNKKQIAPQKIDNTQPFFTEKEEVLKKYYDMMEERASKFETVDPTRSSLIRRNALEDLTALKNATEKEIKYTNFEKEMLAKKPLADDKMINELFEKEMLDQVSPLTQKQLLNRKESIAHLSNKWEDFLNTGRRPDGAEFEILRKELELAGKIKKGQVFTDKELAVEGMKYYNTIAGKIVSAEAPSASQFGRGLQLFRVKDTTEKLARIVSKELEKLRKGESKFGYKSYDKLVKKKKKLIEKGRSTIRVSKQIAKAEEQVAKKITSIENTKLKLEQKDVAKKQKIKLQETKDLIKSSTGKKKEKLFNKAVQLQSDIDFFEGVKKQQIERLETRLTKFKATDKERYDELIQQLGRTVLLNDDKQKTRQLLNMIDSISDSDFYEKIIEWSTTIKLSSPRTHLKNLFGNSARLVVDVLVQDLIRVFKAMAKASGGNFKGSKQELALIKTDFKATLSGIVKGRREFMRAVRDENYSYINSKLLEDVTVGKTALKGDPDTVMGKFMNGLGKTARASSYRMLGAADLMFRTIAQERVMWEEAAKVGKTYDDFIKTADKKTLQKAVKRSMDEADRMTFQEELGKFANVMMMMRDPNLYDSHALKTVSTIFRIFTPFMKTPLNLAKQGMFDFTPIGVLRHLNEPLKKAAKGDTSALKNLTPRQQTAAAEAIVGTTIVGIVYQQVLQGNITGSNPQRSAEKDKFFRENPPYSMKLGGKWVGYNSLDPLGYLLGATANAFQNGQEFDALRLVSSAKDVFLDKTYMKGIDDMFTALGIGLMDNEDWKQKRAISNMIVGMSIPNFISTIARGNSAIKDTRADNFMESLGNQFQASIPGLTENLASKVNVFGNTIDRANKGFGYMFSPIDVKDDYMDPVTRFFEPYGLKISLPTRKLSVDGEVIKLNNHMYEIYSRMLGKRIYSDLADNVTGGYYDDWEREDINKDIKRIRKEHVSDIKDELFRD